MTNKFLLFILFLLLSLNSALAQTKISLITEDYRPPLNMIIDNKIVGISTEIMQEIMKREKIKYTLEVLPWARGFNTTQKKSDTALFSTTRTPERENLFKWVGPIISNNWVFFAKKGSKIKINSLDDAKKYSIGVYTEDAVTEFLQKNGFVRNENLDVSTNDQQNALKLQAGRIDLWASGSALGPWIVKLANAGRIEELYTFNKTELYAAFNINTDDKIINQLNKQLKKMKQDGTVKKIYNKYFYQK